MASRSAEASPADRRPHRLQLVVVLGDRHRAVDRPRHLITPPPRADRARSVPTSSSRRRTDPLVPRGVDPYCLTMPFPRSGFLAKSQNARDRVFRYTLMNTPQRGYGMFETGSGRTVPELLRHIKSFLPKVNVTEAEVGAANRLTFYPSCTDRHFCPRYVVFRSISNRPCSTCKAFQMILVTLRPPAHDQAHRGTVFEETFRRALSTGISARCGAWASVGGASRELDRLE